MRGGVTICATIHSPTPYAFSLFDSLMILLRGRVVYFGDRGADRSNFATDESPPCSAELCCDRLGRARVASPMGSGGMLLSAGTLSNTIAEVLRKCSRTCCST